MNSEKVQGDIVVIGGGLTGIEIAYEYARKGSKVTVLEAMDKYLNVDLVPQIRISCFLRWICIRLTCM